MSKREVGVLVMSYGTPENLQRVEAYYTHIRRGHPPTAQQLKELTDRYASIGGVFPLRENTDRQVRALEEELNRRDPQTSYRCFQGLKHASPFIEDGVKAMAGIGLSEAVGIVLAPHYSRMSVGGYIERAEKTAAETGLSMRFVQSYHMHPDLLQALVDRVNKGLQRFDSEERTKLRVIFTAHSLPAAILETGDPYVDQLLESSRAVAVKSGLINWQFAWQSAGKTGQAWLGPDILDVLRTICREQQVQNALICPIGFVSDHLEVLYDIDVECKSLAKSLGMKLERTESLNVDPLYIRALADAVSRLAAN